MARRIAPDLFRDSLRDGSLGEPPSHPETKTLSLQPRPAATRHLCPSPNAPDRLGRMPSPCSKRTSARNPTPDLSASLCADQPKPACAAHICAAVIIDKMTDWHNIRQ
jgi:hypothetical protein